MPKKIIKPKDTAIFCAKLADEKIASDILMLDISGYETPPADVFLICTSDSSNQSIAILDNIMRNAKSAGISKPRVEGDETSD
jgi:ribosomal silencing factor RsfS